MKKAFLLISGITCAMQTQAHDFYLGIKAAPELHYRNVTGFAQWYIENVNEKEVPAFGFSAGVCGGMNITRRLQIETGLLLQLAGYKSKDISITMQYSTTPGIYRYSKKYTYLNVPMLVNYTFLRMPFISLYASGGLINGVLLHSKNEGNTSGLSTPDNEFESKNTYAAAYKLAVQAGVGVSLALPANIAVRVAPSFQYDITGSENDQNGHIRLWNAALNCSVIRKF